MGDNYKDGAFIPKNQTTGGDISPGSIDFTHLTPSLYTAIRDIQLHKHTGQGSSRVNLQDLGGYVPRTGLIWYSADGTKKYQVTINNVGNFVVTTLT